jgi:glyoxylase-like metal-dependent hydrolase (beta-lactamase superfamily II)
LPFASPRDEQHMLTDPHANLSSLFGLNLVLPPADRLVSPDETLELGRLTFQALRVAGHSPGGLAYFCAAAGVVFTGDALFAGDIGRTDFPGSSGKTLLDNIRKNLFSLPDDTVVYSGHGPATTIAHERATNPNFLGN